MEVKEVSQVSHLTTWTGGVKYKVNYGSYFKIDGDRRGRVLEVRGSKSYVKDWIREKLRKLENGQIKIFKNDFKEDKRDWEQEEEIKKQMWEDVNVNESPKGVDFNEIICQREVQTVYNRPPSPSWYNKRICF